ncbi:MAG: PD40 domain-containing protein [Candidatus Eremiobacteraeota bacterium]|nr:PD40 domain-containing protein [Candidatus Eremiobacteraeota bacterium]
MNIRTSSSLQPRPVVAPVPQKLTDLEFEPRDLQMSPAGDRVIFSAGTDQPLRRELFSLSMTDGAVTQLTNREVNLSWHPSISPDGQKIAYVVEKQGRSDLQVMNIDGSGNVNLSDNNKGFWSPAWSPDGKNIITTSRDTERGNLELVQFAADGTSKAQVSKVGVSTDTPQFSPDGQNIVFALAPGFGPQVLASMSADGSNLKTYSRTVMLVDEPVVTEDNKILFSGSTRDGHYRLYEVAIGSDEEPKLLVDGDRAISPRLSPDGSKIAYVDKGGNGRAQIFEANRDGTEPRQISPDEGYSVSPVYTPDGKKLVYISSREGDREIYSQNIRN